MAAPTTSVYDYLFHDAVTGNNQFIAAGGTHHWYVNTGADDYFQNFYERPTVEKFEMVTAAAIVGDDSELVVGETYSATGFSSPAYYGYVDIVTGRYGFDAQFMYFQIELFSVNEVGNNEVATAKFGDNTVYRVRISDNVHGAGGLMISGEAGTDYTKPEYANWNAQKAFGYLDVNRDVGGPEGIFEVNENPGSMNGYEFKAISDGKVELGNKPTVLWTRYITTADGRPAVEFAFDYVTYNGFFTNYTGSGHADKNYAIFPDDLLYLDFEANRGLKSPANQLWNDKYSAAQAGSPYAGMELENVYELDTLRAVVPEPAGMVMLGLGCLAVFSRTRGYHRHKSVA